MSAWIVQNESINNLVNSIYWLKEPFYNKKEELKKLNIDLDKTEDAEINKELKMLGQLLVNLNQDSINQNYDRTNKPFKFVFEDGQSLNIFQFLKSVHCLIYQSCEGNCEERKEYKFLVNLKRILTDKIIGGLDEYNKAKWE